MIEQNCNHINCNHKIYENNNCIFHCEKNLENSWLVTQDGIKNISEKIIHFWREFEKYYKDLVLLEDIQVPYYDAELSSILNFPDLRKYEELDFRNCTFVDEFTLHNKYNKISMKIISFNNCNFLDEMFINNLELGYFSIIHSKFKTNPAFKNISLSSGAEICNLTSLENNEILINLNTIKANNKQFEIWKIDDKNISFNINSCEFENLHIYQLKCKELKFTDTKLNKLKINALEANRIHLKNVDFSENSRVVFENINCNNFVIDNISQESKYIQFNHILVRDYFLIRKVEFHNTYFNELDISKAIKIIDKVSFANSKLSFINWGEVKEIKASRDFFRELKFVYDENHNYIEANKFYSIEMKKFKDELIEKDKDGNFFEKNFNNFQDKIIFYIGEKLSNFSQSWILPLLWIFTFTLSIFILQEIIKSSSFFKVFILFILFIFSWIIYNCIFEKNEDNKFDIYQHIFLIFAMLVYIVCFSSIESVLHFFHIQSYSDYQKINQNSIFALWFFHKLMLSFIVYQFVIALRRQTRR